MASRTKKSPQATSLRHAMELCLKQARSGRNLSVDRVADLMGLEGKWALYKWLESGRMPANLIRPFEHACGATYLTEYLALSAHKLVIDLPSGRMASPEEVAALQGAAADAVALLARFYRGDAEAEATLAALTRLLEGAAYHREAVRKSDQPELELFEEGR